MNRFLKKYLQKGLTLLILAFVCLPPTQLFADSIYSALGLGLPSYFVSPKAVGMGGAGLAVIDFYALNSMNMAAVDIRGITSVAVDYVYESVDNRFDGNKINTRQGRAAGFRLILPLKRHINLIVAFKPLVSSKYVLSTNSVSSQDVPYYRLIRGNGGLSSGILGVQYIFNKYLSVGAGAHINFGSYEEDWHLKFGNSSYNDLTDETRNHLNGPGFEIGLLTRPTNSLSFGLVYISKSTLDLESKKVIGGTLTTEAVDADIKYPSCVGIGSSYKLKKLLFAFDYYTQFWSNYSINGIKKDNFNDYQRIGGGIEYVDSNDVFVKYLRRIPIRVGAYYAKLPFIDEQNSAVTEKFITFGLGLPYHKHLGRVDLSFEYGKRGDSGKNQYEDKIMRFSVSITGSELWFQRRHN